MCEIVEVLPSWWALLVGSMVGTVGFFGLFWAVWIIALALGIEP